jgi:hypothetical protein
MRGLIWSTGDGGQDLRSFKAHLDDMLIALHLRSFDRISAKYKDIHV